MPDNLIMKIAIDIDGVIDVIPDLLRILTPSLLSEGHHVTILTSRSNEPEVVSISLDEVRQAGIHFTDYYFLPSVEGQAPERFPPELNWFQKHIWQKAEYCKANKVDIMFEDDEKTILLLQIYAPRTKILRVINATTEDI